jgi:hypothetical protein
MTTKSNVLVKNDDKLLNRGYVQCAIEYLCLELFGQPTHLQHATISVESLPTTTCVNRNIFILITQQ